MADWSSDDGINALAVLLKGRPPIVPDYLKVEALEGTLREVRARMNAGAVEVEAALSPYDRALVARLRAIVDEVAARIVQ